MPDVGYMSAADINNSIGVGYTGPQGQNVLNNIFGNFGSTQGQYAPYPMFGEPTMQQPQQQASAYGYGSLYNPNPADDPNSAGRQQQRVNDPDEYNRWYSQWQGLHGGTGGQPTASPGSLMPSAPMQMPNPQALLGYNPNTGYGGYRPSGPDDDPGSAGRQQQRIDNPNEYNRWLNQWQGLHGSASPIAMGPLPPLSLGNQGPRAGPNIDPKFEVYPDTKGVPWTQDYNVINPDQRPSLNYNDPRDRIARLMMSQVATATS